MSEETYAILDFKTTVLHSFYAGLDPDYNTTSEGKKINTVGYFLKTYIDMYINPITAQGIRLNHIIVAKDGGQVFRSILEPKYKATRGKDTDEEHKLRIKECLEAAEELFKSLGIPIVQVDGVEADDVIAYLCHNLKNYVKQVYTVDQDLIQLAVPELATLVFLKGTPTKTMTLKNGSTPLCEILPRHVALCKSIVGDTSDNYGGVKGVGGGGFKSLLDLYGEDGLDELVKIVDDSDWAELTKYAAQDKVLAKLLANKYEWRKGWQLACLNPSLVGEKQGNKFNLPRWIKRLPSKERVVSLLRQHRAEYLVDKVKHLLPVQTLVTADSLVKTPDLLERLKKQVDESPYIAFDYETSDESQHPAFKKAISKGDYVDMLSMSITGAGFTFGNNLQYTCYFSFDHSDTNNLPLQFLKDLFSLLPENTFKVAHNMTFERVVTKTCLDLEIPNMVDTAIMGLEIDENELQGLKHSSKKYLNYNQTKYEEVVEKGKRMKDYSAKHVFKYGADDPMVTAHLYDFYLMIMELEGTAEFCFANRFASAEMDMQMFMHGTEIDWAELDKQHKEAVVFIEKETLELRDLIKTNQTNASVASGIERLVEEYLPVKIAKAKAKAKNTGIDEEKIASDLREDLMADVVYAEYLTEEVDGAFEMTPSAMKKVCTLLGISDCFATSEVFLKECLKNYIGKDEKVIQFLRLAVAAAPYTTKKLRDHPDYQTFKRFVLDSVLEKKVVSSGSELNLGSPKQLQVLLYGMLDLPIKHRSDHLTATQEKLGLTTREPKTDKDAMRIAIVEDTVEGDWRRTALNKILGISAETTRVQNVYSKYPLWVHPKTGLVHPQLNGCATTTRRPTSKNFNKLQLPKRGEGKKIRNCVIPNVKANHDLIVSIDFSQQELRVGAGLSRDEAMLDCFIGYDVEQAITPYVRGLLGEELYSRLIVTKTKDMHTTTAMGILNRRHDYEQELTYEDVVKGIKSGDYLMMSTRVAAKEINFAGAYEVGAYKMSVKLLIPKDEARGLLDSRAKTYCVYEIWRKEAKEFVREFGYAVNLFGSRKHSYADITHYDEYIRGKCERSQVNSQIQSLCADIMHKVGREVRDSRILQTTGAHWINKPYDELVFSMNSQWVVDLVMAVHQIMTQDVVGLCVPMLAEPSLGINWGKQIETGAFPNPTLISRAVSETKHIMRVFSIPEFDSYFKTYTVEEGVEAASKHEEYTDMYYSGTLDKGVTWL